MINRNLRSGIFLAPFHPVDDDPALAIRRDLELIEFIDRLGFEEAWIGEHHSGGFEIISSPELMIAAAAERTQRIRLGTGVVSLPYHNPLHVANRIIQLDHMTMGRVMFGAGPGLLVQDARMIGVDPLLTRNRMVESLEVVLKLLRGEVVTKRTDWFSLEQARVHLRPYSAPHPEVVVASSKTPSGGRTAGRFGIGMLILTASQPDGFDTLAANWQIAKDVAAECGNVMDPDKLRLVAPIHLAETRAQALKNVEFGLERWLDYNLSNNPGTHESIGDLTPIEFVTKIRGGVIGTPDDAINLIDHLHHKQGRFGALLHMAHNWADWEQTKKSYELYARYVAPRIRGSNESRVDSLDALKANMVDIKQTQEAASAKSFAEHQASGQLQS